MGKFIFSEPMLSRLSSYAERAICSAENISRKNKLCGISVSGLLIAILREKGSVGKVAMNAVNLREDDLQKIIASKKTKPYLDLSRIVADAFKIAGQFNYPYVGTEHLVFACLTNNNQETRKILSANPAIKNPVSESLKMILGGSQELSSILKIFDLSENISELPRADRKEKSVLGNFGHNLNDRSAQSDKIAGRDKEISRVINILNRRNKNNPLLIGPPGVGKTAIIHELAKRISSHQVPNSLLRKKIYSLDLGLIVAGTSFRGEFEARLKNIIKECVSNPDIILFIDEIHNLIGTGNAAGSMDAANIFKPYLTQGDLQVMGATTLDEYKKHIEKDGALERRFQTVLIKEPAFQECFEMLSSTKKIYEDFHKLTITDAALKAAIDLSDRHLLSRHLPDKALDLIDEAAAWKKSKCARPNDTIIKKIELERKKEQTIKDKQKMVIGENYEKAIRLKDLEKKLDEELEKLSVLEKNSSEGENILNVTEEDIAEILSLQTGIPSSQLQAKKNLGLKKLISGMSKKIVGQNEALSEISSVLLRSFSGLANRNRPLGSFLFLGPTGVGKTHTAAIVAQELFSQKNALIRIDMSEFMEKHNVSRLIGAPAGYVGYGEGGVLTEKVRHQPHSVILFDEIEKAHPDALNILLQILEDGVLTDASGKMTSFKNTVIILTSNLGGNKLAASNSFGFLKTSKNDSVYERNKLKMLEMMKDELRPELLSRLDKILVFNQLAEASLAEITRLELDNLSERLKKNGIALKIDNAAVRFIAKKSFNLSQGARLVRKNIENFIENKLANFILELESSTNSFEITADTKEIRIATK